MLPSSVLAQQITPDNTLPNPSSVEAGCAVCTIDGGTLQGNNLFHSFTEFSVPQGGEAIFNNLDTVENIFSRVTGNSISEIDGLIRANGTADLFLLNPNGIIFGPNAQLELGGSFIASTADRIVFEDFSFSSIESDVLPLLTVSAPIGLGYRVNNGAIRIEGPGITSMIPSDFGLSVQPGNTLALVGGDITVEKSFLNSPGGRIELGSVADSGIVNLSPISHGWQLDYSKAESFGNITFSRSLVRSSIADDPSLQISSAESAIAIRGFSLDLQRSSLINADSSTAIQVGDIQIDVNRLTLQGGSAITSRTFGDASGGDIVVNALESVEVVGVLSAGPFEFSSSLSTSSGEFDFGESTGDAGTITISTPVLRIQEGATIGATTFSEGNGGNVIINASELVQVAGISNTGSRSSLFASARGSAMGDAGTISVSTPSLVIQEGAEISSLTETDSQGNGGGIVIEADTITIAEGARTTVESRGTGTGGTIEIESNSLILEDDASISARAVSNTGGNINLRIHDFLMLRHESNISTTAGTAQAGGDGGNIIINAESGFVVAALEEDSNITADAFTGQGGDIQITAQGVFGVEPREQATSLSDITASSELGLDGKVQIDTLTFMPNPELVTAPGFLDSSQLLAQSCEQVTADSESQGFFYVSGRGGIVPFTSEALGSGDVLEDLRLPETWADDDAIAEAQDWFMSDTGEVVLTVNPLPEASERRCWR